MDSILPPPQRSSLPGHSVYPSSDSALARYLIRTFRSAPPVDYVHTGFSDSMDGNFGDLWPQNQSQRGHRSTSAFQTTPLIRDGMNRSSSDSRSAINELGLIMKFLCRNIPQSVNAGASMRGSYFSFVLTQCECLSTLKVCWSHVDII